MRISPLAFYLLSVDDINERFRIVKEVSSITHAHNVSVFSCFYYLEFIRGLLNGDDKVKVYNNLKKEVRSFLRKEDINEISKFDKLFEKVLPKLKENEINSDGFL